MTADLPTSGGFRRDGRTGFTVTPTTTTLVGYAGTDPTRLALIASVDAVPGHDTAVAAKTTGTTLTLWGGWYVVASANGAAQHPAWYHNVAAHPDQ